MDVAPTMKQPFSGLPYETALFRATTYFKDLSYQAACSRAIYYYTLSERRKYRFWVPTARLY